MLGIEAISSVGTICSASKIGSRFSLAVRLTPPLKMTLEKALAYIEDDELVEVTPKSIRLRKAMLDPNARKRAFRAKESA
jgi:predicted membrane GTPase involved in stress response